MCTKENICTTCNEYCKNQSSSLNCVQLNDSDPIYTCAQNIETIFQCGKCASITGTMLQLTLPEKTNTVIQFIRVLKISRQYFNVLNVQVLLAQCYNLLSRRRPTQCSNFISQSSLYRYKAPVTECLQCFWHNVQSLMTHCFHLLMCANLKSYCN